MQKIVRELVRPEKTARVIEREDGAYVLEINGQVEAVEHRGKDDKEMGLNQLEISGNGTVVWIGFHLGFTRERFLYIDGKRWIPSGLHLSPSAVYISSNGERMAITCWDGEQIHLFIDGKPCARGEEIQVRFSPDGKRWAATVSGMGYYELIIDGRKVLDLHHPHEYPISLPIFSPDGVSWATTIVTSTEGEIGNRLEELMINGSVICSVKEADFQNSRFSDDGQFFYYITGGKEVELMVSDL